MSKNSQEFLHRLTARIHAYIMGAGFHMRVQDAKRAVQLREWAAQINDRLQSGQSVTAWCSDRGIPTKTYYYRLKQVREELLEAAGPEELSVPGKPVFTALPMPQSGSVSRRASRSRAAAITVRIGGHSAEIQNGADSATIEHVLQILSGL